MMNRRQFHYDRYLAFSFFLLLVIPDVQIPLVSGTARYYGSYLPYGTGDHIIALFHLHGGSHVPHRKWLAECNDGEALVGLTDNIDDYEKLVAMWCKFMFPFKPPSVGLYPYFPSCVVHNYINQTFCFDARNASASINTFVTALWDNEYIFSLARPGTTGTILDDSANYYKCCKTPSGYYIDYVSCYYIPTHDQYFEYYDSPFYFITYCGTGYVMTGLSKKLNPSGDFNLDWLQCCRVGYGAPRAVSSPMIYGKNGAWTFYAKGSSTRSLGQELEYYDSIIVFKNASRMNELDGMRYSKAAIPQALTGRGASFKGVSEFKDPRDAILRMMSE